MSQNTQNLLDIERKLSKTLTRGCLGDSKGTVRLACELILNNINDTINFFSRCQISEQAVKGEFQSLKPSKYPRVFWSKSLDA